MMTHAFNLQVNFWIDGAWKDVIVDDLLMIMSERYGHIPMFARNLTNQHELWPCILEKAFAKLFGSYAATKSGYMDIGVTYLTGASAGIDYEPPEDKGKNMLSMMAHARSNGSTCLLGLSTSGGTEEETDMGIVSGHAYTVLKTVQPAGFTQPLLYIRNPWGNNRADWKGDWGPKSKKWTAGNKKKCNYNPADKEQAGCFFMSYTDAQVGAPNLHNQAVV